MGTWPVFFAGFSLGLVVAVLAVGVGFWFGAGGGR